MKGRKQNLQQTPHPEMEKAGLKDPRFRLCTDAPEAVQHITLGCIQEHLCLLWPRISGIKVDNTFKADPDQSNTHCGGRQTEEEAITDRRQNPK